MLLSILLCPLMATLPALATVKHNGNGDFGSALNALTAGAEDKAQRQNSVHKQFQTQVGHMTADNQFREFMKLKKLHSQGAENSKKAEQVYNRFLDNMDAQHSFGKAVNEGKPFMSHKDMLARAKGQTGSDRTMKKGDSKQGSGGLGRQQSGRLKKSVSCFGLNCFGSAESGTPQQGNSPPGIPKQGSPRKSGEKQSGSKAGSPRKSSEESGALKQKRSETGSPSQGSPGRDKRTQTDLEESASKSSGIKHGLANLGQYVPGNACFGGRCFGSKKPSGSKQVGTKQGDRKKIGSSQGGPALGKAYPAGSIFGSSM